MTQLIQSALLAATPLVLAAIAGIISERTGVLNIALEGLMLAGAFMAGWAGSTASPFIGFLAAVGTGLLLALMLAWLTIYLRGDQVVTAIAFNITILGLTSFSFQTISQSHLNAFSTGNPTLVAVPGISAVPYLGVLFDQHWITYLMYVLVPLTFIVLFRSGIGARMRACGEYAEGARATGVNVLRVRIVAFVASGAVAAIAGAYLVLGDVGRFQENITSGMGYIALTVIILGRWNPLGALIAGVGFGLAEGAGNYVQARGTSVPPEVFFALPYLIGLVAVAAFGRRARPPAEDGRPLQLPS